MSHKKYHSTFQTSIQLSSILFSAMSKMSQEGEGKKGGTCSDLNPLTNDLTGINESINSICHPDMPFLVTHWISHISHLLSNSTESQSAGSQVKSSAQKGREEAIMKITHSASELAYAFQTLGAFGDHHPFNNYSMRSENCQASYSDMLHKYASQLLVPVGSCTILDAILRRSCSLKEIDTNKDQLLKMPWSLLKAAQEGSVPIHISTHDRVEEKINNLESFVRQGYFQGSSMQILSEDNAWTKTEGLSALEVRKRNTLQINAIHLKRELESAMQALKNAEMTGKTQGTVELLRRMVSLSAEKFEETKQNMEQGKRKNTHKFENPTLRSMSNIQQKIYKSRLDQRDLGFGAISRSSGQNNHQNSIAQSALVTRQYQTRFHPSHPSHTCLSVLKSRLSHAVTFSCHLEHPVYCLRFDRTGNCEHLLHFQFTCFN